MLWVAVSSRRYRLEGCPAAFKRCILSWIFHSSPRRREASISSKSLSCASIKEPFALLSLQGHILGIPLSTQRVVGATAPSTSRANTESLQEPIVCICSHGGSLRLAMVGLVTRQNLWTLLIRALLFLKPVLDICLWMCSFVPLVFPVLEFIPPKERVWTTTSQWEEPICFGDTQSWLTWWLLLPSSWALKLFSNVSFIVIQIWWRQLIRGWLPSKK